MRFFKNLYVTVVVLILITLGIRSLITGDSRWGWGMFKEQVNYEISYSWVQTDGNILPFSPGRELRGKASELLRDTGNTRYGYFTAISWLKAYMTELPGLVDVPPKAQIFRAVFDYKLNKKLSGVDTLNYNIVIGEFE